MQRAAAHLALVIPITIMIVLLLLYINTRSLSKTAIIILALPFSAVGAVWYLYIAGFHLSVAVWVGVIALLGVSAETGVVMLLYLDIAYERFKTEGLIKSYDDLKHSIFEGAVKRIRPKMMAVMALLLGLLPIIIGSATGSDVMKRIAAPMFGGIFTSLIMELTVFPPIFYLVKKGEVRRLIAQLKTEKNDERD
jgi:Cu(I)/Ag(I) efflux system membrane protein CusA/SilA